MQPEGTEAAQAEGASRRDTEQSRDGESCKDFWKPASPEKPQRPGMSNTAARPIGCELLMLDGREEHADRQPWGAAAGLVSAAGSTACREVTQEDGGGW